MIMYCDKTPLYLGVPSVFTCVLGAQYDHLIETVLLSTNSIFLLRNKTNNYGLNIIKASGLVVLSVYAGMDVCRQLSVSSSTYHRSLFCDQSCSNQPDQPLILKFGGGGGGGKDPLFPPLDPHLIWSLIGKNLLVLAKLIFLCSLCSRADWFGYNLSGNPEFSYP